MVRAAGPRFGAWLKERRQALDLTQDALAQGAGCSMETIRKIEVGLRRPSRQVAEVLAEVLGVPPAGRPDFLLWARGLPGGAPPVMDGPASGEGHLASRPPPDIGRPPARDAPHPAIAETARTAGPRFGPWLKERRQVLDLTQDALAQQAGCSMETIRKIEAGLRRPSRQIAELLAGVLGIAPAERAEFSLWARGLPGGGRRPRCGWSAVPPSRWPRRGDRPPTCPRPSPL